MIRYNVCIVVVVVVVVVVAVAVTVAARNYSDGKRSSLSDIDDRHARLALPVARPALPRGQSLMNSSVAYYTCRSYLRR